MAATYELISTTTSTSNIVTFSSIPATYTDLRLVVAGKQSNGGTNVLLNMNGDTGTNYSQTWMSTNGSNATSSRFSGFTTIICGLAAGSDATAFSFTADFMNYANTNVYKDILFRTNVTYAADAVVAMWRSTNAIDTLRIEVQAANFTGTVFSLYGIKAA